MFSKKFIGILMLLILAFQVSFFIYGNTVTTQLSLTSKNTVTIALNNQVTNFNPALVNSIYDQYVVSSTFRPLFMINATTTNCSSSLVSWQEYPYLASWYNKSSDSLTWFVNLHAGLKWQDNFPLNTSDLKFAIDSILDPTTSSPLQGQYMAMFSNPSLTSSGLASIQAHASQIINSTMIKIQFGSFSPSQIVNLGSLFPLPKHQLQNEPLANWATDAYNTGAKPIIGDGPYQFMNKTTDGNTVYLQAWSGWNTSYASMFANTPDGATVPVIKNVIFTVISDPATAVTALKNGQIDFIDAQTALNTVFSQINNSAITVSYPALGFQEMGLNMRSPIFGFNPLNPIVDYGESSSFCSSISDIVCMNTTAPTLTSNPKMFMQELQGTVYNQNGKGTNADEFFYSTLNATQRLWIRQAFDYAIARQSIIDSLLGGHGYQIATRLLPQTGLVNTSIIPRQYNLTKAAQLLTQTFGYTYNSSGIDNPNTSWVNESLPYFKVNFMVANNNAIRVQWASLIATALASIGIDITFESVPFTTVLNQIFYNNIKAADGQYGVDYNHGGFDVNFAAWGGSLIPSEAQFYSSKYIAPLGNNYQYLNSSYMDNLMTIESTSSNATARNIAYQQEQQFVYNQALVSMINQAQYIYALSTNLHGFNPFDGPQSRIETWLYGSNQTSVNYGFSFDCPVNTVQSSQSSQSSQSLPSSATTSSSQVITTTSNVYSTSKISTINPSTPFSDFSIIIIAIGSGWIGKNFYSKKRKLK